MGTGRGWACSWASRRSALVLTLILTNVLIGGSGRPTLAADAPQADDPPAIQSISPARLADTRPGYATVDGRVQGVGQVAADSVLEVPVAGRGGVPDHDVAAVMLNVTAVDPVHAGYLTVFPCGTARPTASNVNYVAGQIVPNAVFAKSGEGGAVCIYTLAPIHLVVDVNGYAVRGSGAEPLDPARLVDTRSGHATVDGQMQGVGRLPADGVLEFTVSGRGGVVDELLGAVFLNVTVVNAADAGYVTVYPCDGARPNASVINYSPFQVVPNAVVVKVGDGGKVCIFTLAETDLVVDVNGYVRAGPFATPLVPSRLVDTRPGFTTIDGEFQGIGQRPADSVLVLGVRGRGGVSASGVGGVVLNVAVVNPVAAGFVTVYPCGGPVPRASNLNYTRGQVVANAVLAGVGLQGSVCIYTSAPTDLVVDVYASVAGAQFSQTRGYRSVSVGGKHACALRTDYTTACWGDNGNGLLTPPPGIFTFIDMDGARPCGLRIDNSAVCWGLPFGYFGGDVPPLGGTFNSIAVGGQHTCGLRVNGTAACWGQALDGKTTPPPDLFTALVAGFDFTCGLRADATTTCWGLAAPRPSGTWKSLSAGWTQLCGLRLNDTAECLPGGTQGDTDIPSGPFTAFDTAGGGLACGVRPDRTALCWGQNAYGDHLTAPPGVFTTIVGSAFGFWCGTRPDLTISCWNFDGEIDVPPA